MLNATEGLPGLASGALVLEYIRGCSGCAASRNAAKGNAHERAVVVRSSKTVGASAAILDAYAAFPPRLLRLGVGRVHLFTLLQLALLGGCWAINLSPAGLCVAFLIVALVPLRSHALPWLFSVKELAALDVQE